MKTDMEAGLRKQSFELAFNGGKLWAEHLDSMGGMTDRVLTKLRRDSETFLRPSVSARMIVNLDETVITPQIINALGELLASDRKRFMRIAFVGVPLLKRRSVTKTLAGCGAAVAFFSDYEKAKIWTV